MSLLTTIKMIFYKKSIIYSLAFFSIFSLPQAFDRSLLSELSSDQIEAAKNVIESQSLIISDDKELIESQETIRQYQ